MTETGTNRNIKGENLRQAGYLNVIGGLLDTLVRMVIFFLLNPLIITSLGPILFGVWQIINQMNSYMTTVDLRTGTSIKWYVSKYRTTLESIELRKGITAGFLSNIIFLPVYLITGIIIVWLSPLITKVEPALFDTVRLTTGLLIIAFIIEQYGFLFQSILVGMNLSYKNVGVRILLTVIGGGGTFVAVYLGYGLPAMANVAIAIAILSGITNFWISKRCISWMGFAKVDFKTIRHFLRLTGRFMALKIVTLLTESTDLILLGYFAGPKFVTAYVITRYLVQASSLLLKTVQSSIVPGLGKLVGEGNNEKLVAARKLLIAFHWFSVAFTGCMIVLWNKLFVSMWVSADLYLGSIECLLIVLISGFKILKGIDGSIIIMSLDIKKQVVITGIIALFAIALSSVLIPIYQTLGLLIAILMGEIAMNIAYSGLSQKIVNRVGFIRDFFMSRKTITSILLLILASYTRISTNTKSWASLSASVLITGFVVLILTWFVSMSKEDKEILLYNFKKIRFLKAKC